MKLKTITLHQPWSTLWVTQVKRYETRDWRCWWNGPLAIHAAKRTLNREDRETWDIMRYRMLIGKAGFDSYSDMPYGAVIGVCDRIYNHRTYNFPVGVIEAMMGDFTPGRWAWEPINMRVLPEPVPTRGGQGIWEWEVPDDTLQWMRAQEVRL